MTSKSFNQWISNGSTTTRDTSFPHTTTMMRSTAPAKKGGEEKASHEILNRIQHCLTTNVECNQGCESARPNRLCEMTLNYLTAVFLVWYETKLRTHEHWPSGTDVDLSLQVQHYLKVEQHTSWRVYNNCKLLYQLDNMQWLWINSDWTACKDEILLDPLHLISSNLFKSWSDTLIHEQSPISLYFVAPDTYTTSNGMLPYLWLHYWLCPPLLRFTRLIGIPTTVLQFASTIIYG